MNQQKADEGRSKLAKWKAQLEALEQMPASKASDNERKLLKRYYQKQIAFWEDRIEQESLNQMHRHLNNISVNSPEILAYNGKTI